MIKLQCNVQYDAQNLPVHNYYQQSTLRISEFQNIARNSRLNLEQVSHSSFDGSSPLLMMRLQSLRLVQNFVAY